MSLRKFIGNIKSITSRRLRKEMTSEVNQVYGQQVLGNESYLIANCGGVTISVLTKYIEGQDIPS